MENRTYTILKISFLSIVTLVFISIFIFLLTNGIHYGWKWNFKKEKKIIYEKTYSNSELEQIFIDVKAADITVKSSQDDEIHVTIYGEKQEQASSVLENHQLHITKEEESYFCFGFCSDNSNEIIVYLPKDTHTTLQLKTHSGNVWIGEFAYISVALETDSGDIEIDTVKKADLRTQSGDIRGKSMESVIAQTDSGDIDITHVTKDVDLSTSSGDIDMKKFEIFKNSHIQSNSGDVFISDITDCYLYVKTKNGDIQIKENNRFSELELQIETNSGDITVR